MQVNPPTTVIIHTIMKEKKLSHTRLSRNVSQKKFLRPGRRQSGMVRNIEVDRGKASNHSTDHRHPSGRRHSICQFSTSSSAWLALQHKVTLNHVCIYIYIHIYTYIYILLNKKHHSRRSTKYNINPVHES